jgi:hypothetical protein
MKPHPDAEVPEPGFAPMLRRVSWHAPGSPDRASLCLILLYAALLLAVPWLIFMGPEVMSPSIPAFAQAAEDGRATLHTAAVKAHPAIEIRNRDATRPK